MAGALYTFKDEFYITNAQFEAGQAPIINEDQNSKGFTQTGKPITPDLYTLPVSQKSWISEVSSSETVIGDATWARYTHTNNGDNADPRFSQSLNMDCNIGYMGEMQFTTTPLHIDVDASGLSDSGGTIKYTATNIKSAIPKITDPTPSTGTRYIKTYTYFVVPDDATGSVGDNSSPGKEIYFGQTGNVITQNVGREYYKPQSTLNVSAYTAAGATALMATQSGILTLDASNLPNTYSWTFNIDANTGSLTKSNYTYKLDKGNTSTDRVTASITNPQIISEPGTRTIFMGTSHDVTTRGEFNQSGEYNYEVEFSVNSVSQAQAPIEAPNYDWTHDYKPCNDPDDVNYDPDYNCDCDFEVITTYNNSLNAYGTYAYLTPSSAHTWTPTVTGASGFTGSTSGNNSIAFTVSYNMRQLPNGGIGWGPYHIIPSSNYSGTVSVETNYSQFYQTIANYASGNMHANIAWTLTPSSINVANSSYSITNNSGSSTYNISVPRDTLGVSSMTWGGNYTDRTFGNGNLGNTYTGQAGAVSYTFDSNRGGTNSWSASCTVSSSRGSYTVSGNVSVTRQDTVQTAATVTYSVTCSNNAIITYSVNGSGVVSYTLPACSVSLVDNGLSARFTVTATVKGTATPTLGDQTKTVTKTFDITVSAGTWTPFVS